MLLVYANDIDVTANVKANSIRITEQLNNRANTCSFVVDQATIGEGAKIEIFEGFTLTQQANSGQAVLNVDKTFEFQQKFRPGDEIILKIKGAGQVRKTILSINHTAKTVTLTSNLSANIANGSKCGRLVFAGVTMKNPDEEIGFTGTFSYKVNATDWTKIFDAKNIVQTYADQYSREIFGRLIYEFTANDWQTNLDLFESAWTNAGVALTMVADTTDRIQGTNSMKTGVTGAGTATWTKTITSADLSNADNFRFWWKVAAGYGVRISSVKFRIGTNASNYFEGSSSWIGDAEEDCWNFESFRFDTATVVGTPNQAAVTWLQIEVVATGSISSGNIHFDHALATAGGFTLKNSIRGDRKFEDVRVSYKKPTVFVEDIAKLQNFFWFIDYERDFHFFKQNTSPTPFSISDTSENYDDLSITADISQLKNRQTVRGGEAIDVVPYTQDELCDGKVESWRLDYKPKNLEIWVDTTGTGTSFVQKTVGVENLVDPASVDYVFNFNEKIVRRASDSILPNGTIFRRVYNPYKPIRVRVKDDASITAMKALLGGDGIFDGAVINDESIKDWNEARTRAKAEIQAYSNPVVTATFKTEKDGLRAGQIIRIVDSSRGIDQEFLIQKVSKSSKLNELWTYSVDCGSTMFGLVEFFQLLLKRSEKLLIDVSEIVDIVQNIDEVLVLTDVWTFAVKPNVFYVHSRNGQYSHTLNFTEGGTSNDAYLDFCQLA